MRHIHADLSNEIIESLDVGDHRNLDRLTARAVLGFGLMVTRCFSRGVPPVGLGTADVVHVVANPVAHGAALAAHVGEALEGVDVARIADARLAEGVRVDFDGASLAPRSMSRILSRGYLKRAAGVRRGTRWSDLRGVSKNRLYAEYLFIAQAVRYFAAQDAIASASKSAVVVTDFDRSAYARPWVRAANERGMRTVTLIHGSPTVQHYAPVIAKEAFVWGEVQAEWSRANSPATTPTIVGRPDIERGTIDTTPLTHAIICHSAEVLSADEAERLSSVASELREAGVKVTVRLHPSARETAGPSWAQVEQAADEITMTREPLRSSLMPGVGVIVVTSTSAIEALLSGSRVLVVAGDRELPCDIDAIRTRPTNTVEAFVDGCEGDPDFSKRVVAHAGVDARMRTRAALIA